MDYQRNLQPPTRRTEAQGPSSVEAEPESSLLREARGLVRECPGSPREDRERPERRTPGHPAA